MAWANGELYWFDPMALARRGQNEDENLRAPSQFVHNLDQDLVSTCPIQRRIV